MYFERSSQTFYDCSVLSDQSKKMKSRAGFLRLQSILHFYFFCFHANRGVATCFVVGPLYHCKGADLVRKVASQSRCQYLHQYSGSIRVLKQIVHMLPVPRCRFGSWDGLGVLTRFPLEKPNWKLPVHSACCRPYFEHEHLAHGAVNLFCHQEHLIQRTMLDQVKVTPLDHLYIRFLASAASAYPSCSCCTCLFAGVDRA